MKTKLAENILIVLIGTLLIWQSAYIFCYPQPDTGRWIGDESWRMLTLQGMTTEGKPVIPQAEASTLAQGVGVFHGSVWIMVGMAGVPAHLFSQSIDPISVGRIVSVLLGVLFLFQLYWLLQRFGISRIVNLFAILAVVVSELYLLSSHSARMDIFVANYLLFILYLLDRETKPLILGLVVGASPFIYPHAVTLMAIPSLLICYYFMRARDWRGLMYFASTAALVLGFACGLYTVLTGHFGLFGEPTDRPTQFKGVAASIPIMKFFSWNVQKVNFFGRLGMWLDVAWPMLFGVLAQLLFGKREEGLDQRTKRLLCIAMLIVFSTFLFQGPALYYTIYIVPILVIVIIILLKRYAGSLRVLTPGLTAAVLVISGIAMSAFHAHHLEAHAHAELPALLDNHKAVEELLAPIRSEAHPPKVLADLATTQYLMDQKDVKLMTHHFLWLANSDRDPLEILRSSHVDYVLRYANSPILYPELLADYQPIAEKTGQLLENSYKNPNANCDTLRLYRRVRG